MKLTGTYKNFLNIKKNNFSLIIVKSKSFLLFLNAINQKREDFHPYSLGFIGLKIYSRIKATDNDKSCNYSKFQVLDLLKQGAGVQNGFLQPLLSVSDL